MNLSFCCCTNICDSFGTKGWWVGIRLMWGTSRINRPQQPQPPSPKPPQQSPRKRVPNPRLGCGTNAVRTPCFTLGQGRHVIFTACKFHIIKHFLLFSFPTLLSYAIYDIPYDMLTSYSLSNIHCSDFGVTHSQQPVWTEEDVCLAGARPAITKAEHLQVVRACSWKFAAFWRRKVSGLTAIDMWRFT